MTILKHFMELAGQRVAFTIRGNGPRPLLLLPGALGSAETDFSPQLEAEGPGALSGASFHLIGWDPPGYGYSRPPERTFPKDYFARDARVASRLLKTQAIEFYDLLGWSDGGITALFLAHQQPKRVQSLVIWGANAFIDENDMAIYRGIQDISAWSSKMRAPFEKSYGEADFRALWNRWVDAIIAVAASGTEGNICRDLLPEIHQPTLILHGAKDPVVPEHHAHYLADKLPNAKLVIHPEGKHNLHLRYPEWFRTQVEEFMRELPPHPPHEGDYAASL